MTGIKIIIIIKKKKKKPQVDIPLISIWKVHVLLLPLLSTASHVTSVCPIVKLVPDNGLQIIFNISSELSVTSGSFQTATAYGCPGLVVKVWLIGQTSNDGASMSISNHTWENNRMDFRNWNHGPK